MESTDERKAKKKTSAFVGAVIILAGIGWFVYSQGLIPGLGANTKVANELKAEIEALQGPNIETKLLAAYDRNAAAASPEDSKAFKEMLQSVELSFAYTSLQAIGGDGKGTVEILNPKLSVKSPKDQTPGEISAPKLVVSRDVTDPNHYYYHTEGDVEVYGDMNGQRAKIFSISGEEPSNEIKFDGAGAGYYKSYAKNLKFIEGRGNTVIASIAEASIEASQKKVGSQVDGFAKVSYKDIMPGDMIKMMLGNVEPITLNIDYAYKGDDIQKEMQAFMENQDPAKKIAPFDGDLKLNNFSILTAGAGLSATADLKFNKANSEAYPTGTAQVKISQYQKLLDYANRFAPIPQEVVDKHLQFLSEIGENANGDVTLTFTFDGTSNITVGGKTLAEVEEIHTRYFSPVGMQPVEGLTDGSAPVPPAAVEATPLPASPATPTTTPKN